MSYRVFYACDINGCRNTEQMEMVDNGPLSKIPDGWIVFFRKSPEFSPINGNTVFICAEHAKLFPTMERNK